MFRTCTHCGANFANRESRYCCIDCWAEANSGKLHRARNAEILRLYAGGKFTCMMLAERFGISFGRVAGIIRKASANAKV